MAIMKTWRRCLKLHKSLLLNRIGIIWANQDQKVGKNSHSQILTQTNNHQLTHCTNQATITTTWIAKDKDQWKEEKSHLMTVKMTVDRQWHGSPALNQFEVERNKFLEWTALRNLLNENFCISSKMMIIYFIISICKNLRLSRQLMLTSISRYPIFINLLPRQMVICI